MKTRLGFVSNSSSSSFIVIDYKGRLERLPEDLTRLKVGAKGVTEFGWGPDIIRDIYSRINFAFLQAYYANKDSWFEMIKRVIKANSHVESFENRMSDNYGDEDGKIYSYIDHQSAYPDNTTMFDSEDDMTRFLFGADSKIVLDNDNH